MKTILKIGYHEFMLAPKANVNSLLSTLCEATPVDGTYEDGRYFYVPSKTGSINVEVKMITDSEFRQPPKPKQIPESASPDAHNTDIAEFPIAVRKIV